MANPPQRFTSNQAIVLWGLGLLAAISLIGYIVLGVIHSDINTEPLTAVTSACVGSLGTYLATMGNSEVEKNDPQEDYELLIGRAATRSMIAEAMRQMGVGASGPPPPGGTS